MNCSSRMMASNLKCTLPAMVSSWTRSFSFARGRYVRFLGLTDHVDLAVFFHLGIHPHLHVDVGGQWQFAYCLMVVCMQALDTSTCLTFTSVWSPDDAAGEGLTAFYRASCHLMRLYFMSEDDVNKYAVCIYANMRICEYRKYAGCEAAKSKRGGL